MISFLTNLLLVTAVTDSDVVKFWDEKAEEWHRHVGDDGSNNPYRFYVSDPVLWDLLGDVQGKNVLDLGCGTGYLSRQLAKKGAEVIAVDLSPNMIEVAKKYSPFFNIDYRVESGRDLKSISDASLDAIVCNFVLMDCADLGNTISECYRVLKRDGTAVFVFLHPCFPLAKCTKNDHSISYLWNKSYFDSFAYLIPPPDDIPEVTTDILTIQRPLSAYWKAFRSAGFIVDDFREPCLNESTRKTLDPALVQIFEMQPITVAFLLRKSL